MECKPSQSVAERRNGAFGQGASGPSHGSETVKGPGKREQELKASQYGYNQGKNQGII